MIDVLGKWRRGAGLKGEGVNSVLSWLDFGVAC